MGARAVFVIILVASAAGVVLTQGYVDQCTDRTPEVEMRYLLQTKNLQRASLGYPQLVADLVWIKAIQFYHQQFINRVEGETDPEKTRYKFLLQISNLVTDLNPRFVHAYWFFALYLGGAEVDGPGWFDSTKSLSIELMQKGVENNPDTYFLSSNLAFSYLQLHRRLSEQESLPGMTMERRAELLDLYYSECLRLADHASAAADAPEHVRLWGFSVRNALGGDQCETFVLLRQLYEDSSQDIERQSQLFALVLAADRCNMQTLERRAAELGISLEPGTAADLEQALGMRIPSSPWSPILELSQEGDLPPETFVELMNLSDQQRRRYEYFVAASGELISWYDGERRENSQREVATQICQIFERQFGFWPHLPQYAAECLEREIVENPFGRRYVLDPFERIAYPEVAQEDLPDRMRDLYDTPPVEERRQRMQEIVRSVDAAITRDLRENLVQPWMQAHPGQSADLTQLLAGRRMPVSPWRLLDRLADVPDDELPSTARELVDLIPRPETGEPDYVVDADGEVIARPVAELLRSELLGFLQKRLDAYVEEFGAAPTVLQDLHRDLSRPLPPDPFGGEFAVAPDGAKVIVRER